MTWEQHQPATELVAETSPAVLLDGRPSERGSGLDVNEALHRMRLHWRLMLAFALMGLAAGYGLHFKDRPMYAASARVVLDTPDTQAQSDSQAYADGARAIVTSRSHVAAALASIQVSRDPAKVAAQNVSLQAVGTSSIQQITVTDQDPHVAAGLANALATDLVQTRRELRAGKQALPIDKQIVSVQSSIGALDVQLKTVTAELQQASPNDVPRLSGLLSDLVSERAGLVQEEDTLLTLRTPMVIDPAAVPTTPMPTRLTLDMALGLLLGLAVGIGAAGLSETLRPTIASARAVSRALDAPVLGELEGHPGTVPLVLDPMLGLRLRRLAKEASVQTVELATVGPPTDLQRLARQLQMHVNGHPLLRESSTAPKGAGPAVRVFGSPSTRTNGAAPSIGLLVITPSIVKRADLETATELSLLTEWPLLGVLTYRGGRSGSRQQPAPRTARQGGSDEVAL